MTFLNLNLKYHKFEKRYKYYWLTEVGGDERISSQELFTIHLYNLKLFHMENHMFQYAKIRNNIS